MRDVNIDPPMTLVKRKNGLPTPSAYCAQDHPAFRYSLEPRCLSALVLARPSPLLLPLFSSIRLLHPLKIRSLLGIVPDTDTTIV